MRENNYAFIDAQNLYLGMRNLFWKLDLLKFAIYLKNKYKVSKIYYFIGYVEKNNKLYKFLEDCGYTIVFREISIKAGGEIKGNVDIDLTVKVFDEIDNFDTAIIVTSDGDFYSLIVSLIKRRKLKAILSISYGYTSYLLKKYGHNHISYIEKLKCKVEYIKKEEDPD